jgi:putative RNA 2'-phosphotransferase
MDHAGWTSVSDVLELTGITPAELQRAVDENDKGRLQLDGSRIRACQGHSLQDMPVTREGLEASWEVAKPEAPLWHGTTLAALAGIGRSGIQPGARSHVHLAASPDSRTGKRAGVEVLLVVESALLLRSGITVFRSPNGVLLVREVPTNAIVDTRPVRAARDVAERACAAAGLPFRSTA